MANLFNKMFAKVDMTEGSPAKKILQFTLPMLVGNFAQQMYNTVDSVIVGKYVGDDALSAVGSASPILNLLYVLFVGISVGIGIMVAQYYGAKERENLSKSIGTSLSLTLISSLFVMVLAVFVTRPLLKLLDTPDTTIEWCYQYLMIFFLGIAGCAYYNILGGILRGFGDSASALIYLLIATVVNMVLDYVFVRYLGLEVAGVALATVIAQTLSAVLCYRKLRSMKDQFDSDRKYFKPSAVHTKMIVRLGIPSGLTQAIFSMAMLMVQRLTNSFGTTFIAANVIVMRVDGFAMLPNFSFGTALTTYAGQNIGAKKLDRVKEGTKQGLIMAVGTSAVLTGIILLFGRGLMGIFTNTDELVDLSRRIMGILAVGYIAMAVTQTLSGVMRGAGDTMSPMWISIITTVVIRVPLAYLMASLIAKGDFAEVAPEVPAAALAIPVSLLISWVCGAIITTVAYRVGKWKQKAII